jgi:hypothetical protein
MWVLSFLISQSKYRINPTFNEIPEAETYEPIDTEIPDLDDMEDDDFVIDTPEIVFEDDEDLSYDFENDDDYFYGDDPPSADEPIDDSGLSLDLYS